MPGTQQIQHPEEFGPLFDPSQDGPRLQRAMALVRDYCLGSHWRTLKQIEAATGVPQASASAHLRHLTRPEWGGYIKERRTADPEHGRGLFEYRLQPGTEEYQPHAPKPATRLRILTARAQEALTELRAGRIRTAEAILTNALGEGAC